MCVYAWLSTRRYVTNLALIFNVRQKKLPIKKENKQEITKFLQSAVIRNCAETIKN